MDRNHKLDDGYTSEKNDSLQGTVLSMNIDHNSNVMNRQNITSSDVESGDDKESLLPKSKEPTEEPAASSKQVVFWLLFWMAK